MSFSLLRCKGVQRFDWDVKHEGNENTHILRYAGELPCVRHSEEGMLEKTENKRISDSLNASQCAREKKSNAKRMKALCTQTLFL